jgi:polysaccharide biosynthesis/export protein
MKSFGGDKLDPWVAVIVGVLLSIALSGCQKQLQPVKTPVEMASELPPKLMLGPGDVLDVKFFYAPELNESQPVRPDGKITLQLVGEVDVTGKSPMELKDALISAYAGQLKKPEVAVVVRTLNNRRVYVGGEVRTPGLIPMPGQLTVLEAVMLAGGFNYLSADRRNIVVIRERDGKYYGTALDYQDTLEGKAGQAFYVQPLDIVYVSSTQITDVNRWIAQNINGVIPSFMQVIYNRKLGDGTISLGAVGTR